MGKALLATLLEWARRNPLIEKVALAVFSTNTPALQLYRKVGFKEEGRRLREYQLPEGAYIDDKRYDVGIEGAKAHILGVRETYADLHMTIDRQIAEGEWVVSCITAKGTHKGSWMGIKPTGKIVAFTGVNVDRVVDGRIVEHGGAANMLGPLLDIGAIKVVGE